MSIKEIREELNELYNAVAADENQGFGWTLAEGEERIEYLEGLLKELEGRDTLSTSTEKGNDL